MMNKIFTISIVMMIMMSAFALAGVSSPYWKGDYSGDPNARPLTLYPGQKADFAFTLLNSGATNENYQVTITSGNEVLKVIDGNDMYSVPAGTEGVKVNFNAEIPADTPIGTSYKAVIEFRGAPESESGQFQFGSGYTKAFDINVVEKPQEPVVAVAENVEVPKSANYSWMIIAAVLIAIVALIVLLVRKR